MPKKPAVEPYADRYTVDGRTFVWTTEDGEKLSIPLRLKLKVIRQMADVELDAAGMFVMLEQMMPDQADLLDDMDLNDFQAMFITWQNEYNKRSGATPGE